MRDTLTMAREAGLRVGPAGMGQTVWGDDTNLKRFEALVRADERNRTWTQEHWTEYERSIAAQEREACAKVCDALHYEVDAYGAQCAAAIRARKETK